MGKIAITGSFDPPHAGHKWLVDTLKSAGHDVTVVVANNADKTYMFPDHTRVQLCKDMIGTDVLFTADSDISAFLKSNEIFTIARGIRTTHDLQYEQVISEFFRERGIIVMCLLSPPHLATLSSTLIREMYENNIS